MEPRRVIGIVQPAPPGITGGNRVTALRWARHLRALGWRVFVEREWSGRACGVLVVLNARRSRASIERFREAWPDAPLVVVATGTDVYGDGPPEPAVARALAAADRVVVLQDLALESLPADVRARGRVVHQSARPPVHPPAPAEDAFEVLVVAHLRPVKSPLLTARAARRLPASSRVRVLHVGRALDAAAGAEAEREAADNPRFRWLGERPRAETLGLVASSRLLISPSRHEGGANVVTEALACATPVLATRIPGSVGLLGADHPGLFEVGDEAGLAALLARAEGEPGFLDALRRAGRARAWITDPERERRAWSALLDELAKPGVR